MQLPILAITLAFSVFSNIALAAEVVRPEPKPVTNLHDSQGIHEDLIASQELIALGCMGKLNIAPTASGSYDSALRVENLVDTLMHRTLMDELNDEATEVIDSLNQNAQEGCGCLH
ncbi:hypothetical protein CXB40_30275 [Pseudomonas syringae pv. avii]|uniref:hypothetical protein n=1 Tax=Pseudomonas syringae TaxID=317 RepID=UPI000CDA9286|nr:hypothetical protein [Pseudomonas syringae]POP89164.1 hypothetical protein CXB40_30275 [Pseudomonas syringae pv. avii]